MKTKLIVSTVTAALCALLCFSGSVMADAVAPGSTTLESIRTNGTQGNGQSYYPAISADGRYIAFQSYASTLTGNDTNNYPDIFIRDTVDATTTLISVAAFYGTYGYGANNSSSNPAINGTGQYVAFDSYATNLVAGGTSGQQIFVRDTVAGTTELVSPNYGGTYGAYGYGANGNSSYPSISFDGRYVAFQTYATNLTAGTDSNGDSDIYIRDTQAGTTTRILAYGGNQPNNHSESPAMAGDGSAVAFESYATNLLATNNPGGTYYDIFVYDTASGAIELISQNYGGGAGAYGYGANNYCYNPAISYGGRYVAFDSQATNLVYGGSNGNQQVFVYDRTTGEMVVASAVDGDTAQGYGGSSQKPSISPDGRYVAFTSRATNLADVNNADGNYSFTYLRDTVDQSTTLISRIDNTVGGYGAGTYGGNSYNRPAVSACGMYVAFDGDGDYFVDGDVNDYSDVFLTLNDTDGDGIADTDSDGDGTPDCVDLCPDDPNKIDPGACGCGVADTDTDGDGTPDCLDADDDDDAPAPRLPDTDTTASCFISTIIY